MSGLRLAELPALLWVLPAGKQARARLRRVLAARRRAALRSTPEYQVGRGLAVGLASGRGTTAAPEAGLPPGGDPPSAALAPPREEILLMSPLGVVCITLPCAEDGHEPLRLEGRGQVCSTCELADPTLKAWIEAEAARRGQNVREYMDDVMSRVRGEAAPAEAFEA